MEEKIWFIAIVDGISKEIEQIILDMGGNVKDYQKSKKFIVQGTCVYTFTILCDEKTFNEISDRMAEITYTEKYTF